MDKFLSTASRTVHSFNLALVLKKLDFEEIGKEKLDLSKEREKLNVEQCDLCEKIAVLEEKSPDFSLEQFREVSFLKYALSQKLKDMEVVKQESNTTYPRK